MVLRPIFSVHTCVAGFSILKQPSARSIVGSVTRRAETPQPKGEEALALKWDGDPYEG